MKTMLQLISEIYAPVASDAYNWNHQYYPPMSKHSRGCIRRELYMQSPSGHNLSISTKQNDGSKKHSFDFSVNGRVSNKYPHHKM